MTRSTGHIVLLVDDAPQSLGALAAELTADGCTVLIADSGEAALQRLDLVSPDAVVLHRGFSGSDSILLRMRRTCTVTVAGSCQSGDDCHTSLSRSARENTWRGEAARWASTSNSLGVISTVAPLQMTSRDRVSMSSPSNSNTGIASFTFGAARRSTPFTRAASSRGENGLTT